MQSTTLCSVPIHHEPMPMRVFWRSGPRVPVLPRCKWNGIAHGFSTRCSTGLTSLSRRLPFITAISRATSPLLRMACWKGACPIFRPHRDTGKFTGISRCQGDVKHEGLCGQQKIAGADGLA